MASALYGRGAELKRNERLCLYRLVQTAKVENGKLTPRLNVNVEVLDYDICQREQPFADIELREVNGRLALVGDVLGDALVESDMQGLGAGDFGYVFRNVDKPGHASVVWNGARARKGVFRTKPGDVEIVSMFGERRTVKTKMSRSRSST